MLLFLGYLVAILVTTFLIAPRVVEGVLSGLCEDCLAYLFLVNPFSPRPFQVLPLAGSSFLLWFFIVMGLLAALYLYMLLFHGRGAWTSLRLPLARVVEKARSGSALVAVGQIFLAILFFDLLYFVLILPALGIQPTTPPGFEELPDWYLMYSLLEAAFVEEVATRVALIGLPLALGSVAIRLFQASRGTRRTPGYVLAALKHLGGGQVHMGSSALTRAAAAVLLLLSAAFFGYLHVLTWGVAWKFVDTFIGGLALGFLFLRRGIAASILLHFAINAFTILITAAGGEESLLSLLLAGLFYLALAALGAGFFLFYVWEAGRLLVRAPPRAERAAPAAPRASLGPAQPPSEGAFPVTCPHCGSREAVYEEGALRCAACGRPL